MRRREAVTALAAALLLVVAGVVWLWGPYGLIGSGVGLALLTLFVFDIREERRAEPVVSPARPVARR